MLSDLLQGSISSSLNEQPQGVGYSEDQMRGYIILKGYGVRWGIALGTQNIVLNKG